MAWSTELEMPEGPGGVMVSVVNARPGVGTVSCRLRHGGKVVAEATSTLIADCSVRDEELFGR